QFTRRLEGAWRPHPTLNDIFGKTQQRICKNGRVDDGVGEYGGRLYIGLSATFFDFQSSRGQIDCFGGAKITTVRQMQQISLYNLDLLGRKRVSIDWTTLRSANSVHIVKACDRGGLIQEF